MTTTVNGYTIEPYADLGGADLEGANLRRADFRIANLRGANLEGASLEGADLRGANLEGANLEGANLEGANLRGANLRGANLRRANLRIADLRGADLRGADLGEADLRGADLGGADLREADLRGANLSQTQGLPSSSHTLSQHFQLDSSGHLIVYKAIGGTYYSAPPTWDLKPGSIIEEVPNPCRTTECGCGVNFGTLAWIKANFPEAEEIWECRIAPLDLADVVVPYNFDGKARCARLELVRVLEEGE